MDYAHKSNPYYADSHHRRISFVNRGLRCRLIFLVRSICTSLTDFLAQFLALLVGVSYAANAWCDRRVDTWVKGR
jgi:hypothetical protein